MATIGKRINENGEKEITITDINNDLNSLISTINKFRIEELQKTKSIHIKKIFITEDLKFSNKTFNVIFSNIFSNCVFEGEVNFSFASFNTCIDFSNTTFKLDVCFIKSTFENIIKPVVHFKLY